MRANASTSIWSTATATAGYDGRWPDRPRRSRRQRRSVRRRGLRHDHRPGFDDLEVVDDVDEEPERACPSTYPNGVRARPERLEEHVVAVKAAHALPCMDAFF